MEKELYSKFIEISNKISDLENQKKVIKEQVMKKFEAEKLDKAESDNGLITLASRKSWKYSDNVKKADTELKELKKVEEETGVAEESETKYLRVTLR